MAEKCPRCGSTLTAHIMYGMPAMDAELERQIADKQIFIGGCCIDTDSPKFHCFECDHNFFNQPIIASKEHGIESLPDIVTSITFVIGGYFGGFQKIRIGKYHNRYCATIFPNSYEPDSVSYTHAMTKEEWHSFIRMLFDMAYLHEWAERYDDPDILDGEQWELTVRMTNRRKRFIYGSNSFPPYWVEFLNALRPYFDMAGQHLSSNGEPYEEEEEVDHEEELRKHFAGRAAEYHMFMDD